MCRQSTLEKEKILLKEFHRILRSGKDLTAESMYEDAGKKVFLEGGTVGNIIRRHYRNLITDEMRIFVSENEHLKFKLLLTSFCKKYKFCKREGRLIIGYIR